MWLITPRGFYSAVNDPARPGTVKVRSRVREDLEALCELAPMRRYANRIEESLWNDYRFRIYVKKRHWRRTLPLLADEITYGNHKDEVKARQGPERAAIYSNVWWELLSLQEPRTRWDRLPDPDDDDLTLIDPWAKWAEEIAGEAPDEPIP